MRKHKIMLLGLFITLAISPALYYTLDGQLKGDVSKQPKISSFSGISVGDKWTITFDFSGVNVSYEVTSVNSTTVMADTYTYGVPGGNLNISGDFVLDDIQKASFILIYGTTTGTYGGQQLTVCNTGGLDNMIFDVATGIILQNLLYYLSSWDLYGVDSINILEPNASSSWGTGTSQFITWISTGSITNVKIDLYLNGIHNKTIVASTPNDGSHPWPIGTDLTNSTQYQTKISDVLNAATFDDSDSFEIFTQPTLPSDTVDGEILGYEFSIVLIIFTFAIIGIVVLIKKKNK